MIYHDRPSLGFPENDPKKGKYPARASCVEGNTPAGVGGGSEVNGQTVYFRDRRKATVTQITTGCSQGVQNGVSEGTRQNFEVHAYRGARRWCTWVIGLQVLHPSGFLSWPHRRWKRRPRSITEAAVLLLLHASSIEMSLFVCLFVGISKLRALITSLDILQVPDKEFKRNNHRRF